MTPEDIIAQKRKIEGSTHLPWESTARKPYIPQNNLTISDVFREIQARPSSLPNYAVSLLGKSTPNPSQLKSFESEPNARPRLLALVN